MHKSNKAFQFAHLKRNLFPRRLRWNNTSIKASSPNLKQKTKTRDEEDEISGEAGRSWLSTSLLELQVEFLLRMNWRNAMPIVNMVHHRRGFPRFRSL